MFRHEIYKGVIFLVVGLLFGPSAWAQMSDTEISSDELLEYTLTDLNKRMEKLAEENKRLKDKNESLRRRMDYLEVKAAEYREDKILIFDDLNELKGDIDVESVESSVVKLRATNIDENQDYLFDEHKRLKWLISDQQKKHSFLQENIEQAKAKITQFQNYLEQFDFSRTSQEEGINQFGTLDRLKDARLQVKEFKRERQQMDKIIKSTRNTYQEELKRNETLNEKYSELYADLQEKIDEELGLENKNRRVSHNRVQQLNVSNQEVSDLRGQADLLKKTIEEYLSARTKIADELPAIIQLVGDFNTLLKRESQYLLAQEKNAQELIKLYEKNKSIFKQNGELGQEKEQFEREIAILREEQDHITQDIENYRRQLAEIREQRTALQTEVSHLDSDLAEAQRQNENLRKNRNKDRYRDIQNQLRVIAGAKNKLENEITALNKYINHKEEVVDQLMGAQNDFRLQIEEMEQRYITLAKEHTVLEQQKQNLDSEYKIHNQAIKEEVEALQMRNQVLSSTLTHVDDEYDAREVSSRSFFREQRDLDNYLAVLRQENEELQEKYLSTMMAMDRLKQKRKLLLKP